MRPKPARVAVEQLNFRESPAGLWLHGLVPVDFSFREFEAGLGQPITGSQQSPTGERLILRTSGLHPADHQALNGAIASHSSDVSTCGHRELPTSVGMFELENEIDDLTSILAAWDLNGRGISGPNSPVLPKSHLDLVVMAGQQPLSETDEQGNGKPGWWLPVNWSDDDSDGWGGDNPPGVELSVYTPDKDDSAISVSGGDPDLFPFNVAFSLVPNPPGPPDPVPNGDVKVTFDSNRIRIWRTRDKTGGQITSGTLLNYRTENFAANGYKTFYAEGISGSQSFKDAFLKIQGMNIVNAYPLDTVTDDAEVTCFEVSNHGEYGPGPKSTDNAFDFADAHASSNQLGIRSWESDANCEFFHNCMEMQGTVSPTVVQGSYYPYGLGQAPPSGPSIVSFDAERDVYGAFWMQRRSDGGWEEPPTPHYQWVDDSTGAAGKETVPTSNSHIYFSDGPGIYSNQSTDYISYQLTDDFKNWFDAYIYGRDYQISDVSKWHSKTAVTLDITDPQERLVLARADFQALGTGWIEIPLSHY